MNIRERVIIKLIHSTERNDIEKEETEDITESIDVQDSDDGRLLGFCPVFDSALDIGEGFTTV